MALVILAGILTLPLIHAINVTFTSQPGDLQVKEGSAFMLSCNVIVEGNADNTTLQYYWNKDGELYTNGSKVSIASADTSHSGVYVCIVSINGIGTEMEIHSRNATVRVLRSEMDSAPRIAIIVSVTAVSIIIFLFLFAIGIYMCCWGPERHNRFCHAHKRRVGGRKHHRVPIPGRLSPSAPRHFSNRVRSKSKSLSHLLPSDFPLNMTLHKSSTDLLAGSQPTQATEIEDHNTLDFDLALDEDMFEQELSTDDKATLLARTRASQRRNLKGVGEAKRRASEGTLVVPEAVQTSRKSILKASKSFNENLNTHRRNSAVSDISSDVTQSDENSLQLGKSVRFNVSGDGWAEDSGVNTGSSTPHNSTYPNLNRRASEPETFVYHSTNSERRGSAPGDLASNTVTDEIQKENDAENEGEGDNSGEIDEGLVTGSEEWTQQQNDFSFDMTQAEKRFEIAFSQPTREPDTIPTQPEVVVEHKSSGIASLMAQLITASQKQTEGSFIKGPSPLTTTSHTAVVSKVKVAEMKERFLQRKGLGGGGSGNTVKSEGKKLSLSKLVQERVEVFKEKHETEGLDMGTLKREHQQKCVGEKATTKETSKSGTKKIPLQEFKMVDKQPDTIPASSPALVAQPTLSNKTLSDEKTGNKTVDPPRQTGDKSTTESRPVTIPVFSRPSSLSTWVPACLRDTVVSPNLSYRDGDNEMSECQDTSDDSDGDDIIMEPMEPTVGRALTGTGAITSMASFGGVASMSPMGRSWLSSVKPSGSQIMPLSNKPGAKGISPFNESFSFQRGEAGWAGAMQRLSVIPEETASACNSMVDMYA